MGKRLIIIGADFSENCIPVGPQPSENKITMDLSDGHKTAIYRSQSGGALKEYSTGYDGWARQLISDLTGYTKIAGKTTYYNYNNIFLPSIVFLNGQDEVVSSYVPNGTVLEWGSDYGYVGEFSDISIPAGATQLYVQCFTGQPARGRIYTDQRLYLVP